MDALKSKWVWALFAVFVFALALRLGGISQLYHQDEYKWAVVASGQQTDISINHPPLALFLYMHVGAAAGYDNLRVIPAAASLITLVLLMWYMRRRWGGAAAAVSGLVFAAAPYALIGSLQIDIDGAFLPLATMAAFLGYLLWQHKHRAGLPLLFVALVAGLAFKLSFVLVPLALAADLLWERPHLLRPLLRRQIIIPAALLLGIAAGALAVLWQHVTILRYVDNFVALGGRDYFQLLFQTVKAAIYLSPLPLLGIVLAWRHRRELRVWYIFLALNFLFYFVVFDFSHRTFDRYLLFLLVPCAVLAGVVLKDVAMRTAARWAAGSAVVLGAATWVLFAMPHMVYPLIPKSAFVHAALTLHWRFLLPMTGGSGPAGFYLPVDALALLWAAGTAALGAALFTRYRTAALSVLVGATIVYAGFVDAEYLRGAFYGSTAQVEHALVDGLTPAVVPGGVLTYNDLAAYELIERGVYAARFYPHPEFIPGNIEKFRTHPGYYLVVEMPELNQAGGYEAFFAGCAKAKTAQSGLIAGYLYNCRGADPSVIGAP